MKKSTPKKQMSWRNYRLMIDPKTAIHRLATCPVASVQEKLKIEIRKYEYRSAAHITYLTGMNTATEKACVNWILRSLVPDEAQLTSEIIDPIFNWVRETLCA